MIVAVYPSQNRDPGLEVSGEKIGFYEREFYPLSNFSSFQVEINGVLYPTSEHAYHAAKFVDTRPDLAEVIRLCRSAHAAFKTAHSYGEFKREDWDEVKIAIMERILISKAEQNPYVYAKLMDTGDLELIEDSPKDSFWGWGADRQGRNELGKAWMKIRQMFNDLPF